MPRLAAVPAIASVLFLAGCAMGTLAGSLEAHPSAAPPSVPPAVAVSSPGQNAADQLFCDLLAAMATPAIAAPEGLSPAFAASPAVASTPAANLATPTPAPSRSPAPTAAAAPTLQATVKAMSGATVRLSSDRGRGSGFVIDLHGYILTAEHVVADLASVLVTFPSGEEEIGLVVGRDEIRDLAVVKVNGSRDMPVARLGRLDALSVGDQVLAIGYTSISDGISVTSGVVSDVVPREREEFSFLQTDAGFYAGQSGGPVIGPDGRVVAVVSRAPFTGSGAPAGWAIALDDFTLWVVERLKAGESILLPRPAAIGLARENPAPLGHVVRVRGTAFDGTTTVHDISVTQVLRGDDALALVMDTYQYNAPPPQGAEYLLAMVRVKYVRGPLNETDWIHQVDFSLLDGKGIKYRNLLTAIPPQPFLSARMYPGATYEAWTMWEMAAWDTDPLLVFGLDWSMRGLAFFATTPDRGPVAQPAEEGQP